MKVFHIVLPARLQVDQYRSVIRHGIDLVESYRRAAVYADKILHGAKPSGLPVELPTRFELVVNLKTARAVGLAIPESFLVRADDVIE